MKLANCGVGALFLAGVMMLGQVQLPAQETGGTGWYVGIEGAYSIMGEERAEGAALDLQSDYNDGWALSGLAGHDFGAIRLEGEVSRHTHELGHFIIANDADLALGGPGAVTGFGKSRVTSVMANLVFDMDTLWQNRAVTPFLGAGAGFAHVKLENLRTAAAIFTDDSDTVFSYQAFAGLRIPLAEAFDAILKYRYKATAGSSLNDRLARAFDEGYDSHDLVLGLTYRFGGPPQQPAAAALPPPEPREQPAELTEPSPPEPAAGPTLTPFLAYFDWDSARIRPDAQAVIVEAARAAKQGRNVRIHAAGHADRSGPMTYNEDLSRRRAESVRAALVDEGIAESDIMIEYFGERRPAVRTGDGVREQRNRRVVIVLKP